MWLLISSVITVIFMECLHAVDLDWVGIQSVPSAYYSIPTQNVLRCGKLCERQGRCSAATFDYRERMCHLHIADPTVVETNTHNGRYLFKRYPQNSQNYDLNYSCDKDTQIAVPSAYKEHSCYDMRQKSSNGYMYDSTYTHWYRIGLHDGRTWIEHRDICRSEGGRLMTIKDNDMRLWLRDIILKTPGGPDITVWHVDGNDINGEGNFVDEDGNSAYLAWAGDSPNNLAVQPIHIEQGQDCLALDSRLLYLMNDLSCYWNYYPYNGYVCQIPI